MKKSTKKAPENIEVSGAEELVTAVGEESFQISGPGIEYPWSKAWYKVESVAGRIVTLVLDHSKKRQDDLRYPS